MSKKTFKSVDDYLASLDEIRKPKIKKLREIFLKNLPSGFEERISYGMIGYVVPHEIYPEGYHCTPELPLPFLNIASQKSHIAIYHMGLYAQKELSDWFKKEYSKYNIKLDMGKSCIRFKDNVEIPYKLFEELAKKITVKEYIDYYEKALKSSDKSK